MQQSTHKTLYNTHGWIGIISGILLFIVTFSGIPALFEEELSHWQSANNPVLNVQQQDLDKALLTAQAQGFDHSTFFIQPASEVDGNIYIAHYPEDETPAHIVKINPNNGQVLPEANSDMAELLGHLHTDLHLPHPWGRYLVGFAGMAMLLAIIAGIFIHLKWRKEFVMLRPKRSWRLLLTDQHKLLGLWSLPFTLILAFSGTILGLLGLISPILAVAAFNGDVPKATEAVLGPVATITQEYAPSQSINDFVLKQRHDMPNIEMDFIFIDGLNDKGGFIKFSGNHKSKLSNLESITYKLASGDQVHRGSFVEKGPFQRIFAAVTPLHYVLYGNGWLKLLYALSALAACGLIVSGNMLWLERRHGGKRNADHTKVAKNHWLGQLTLGTCGGLVVATTAVIAASQVLRIFNLGHQQVQWEQALFWGTWVGLIVLPFVYHNSFKLSHFMMRASGLLLLVTLLADGLINGRWLWHSQGWVFNMQCGFLISALLCFYLDFKIPHVREEKASKSATKNLVTTEEQDNRDLDSVA
ncbi:hypothetical protein A9Q73_10875 [Bermanella sp. 47_1433_sub80_T6]|nr:hypothetical protein A9Q73_10875 [Bermanella sp. 47_1433_sub80_T6]